jgi:hypothetical protein
MAVAARVGATRLIDNLLIDIPTQAATGTAGADHERNGHVLPPSSHRP